MNAYQKSVSIPACQKSVGIPAMYHGLAPAVLFKCQLACFTIVVSIFLRRQKSGMCPSIDAE